MARKELGCAGHFICAKDCNYRRHTQIDGSYRISTVGDYWINDRRETLGAGKDSFYETMVFRTNGKPVDNSENCGCVQVSEWCEIDSQRYKTASEAHEGHERFVRKYMAKARSK